MPGTPILCAHHETPDNCGLAAARASEFLVALREVRRDADGDLLKALRRQSRLGGSWVVDVVKVGGVDAPPFSTPDPDLLIWCEANDRILVTNDRNTMPGHFNDHLAAGQAGDRMEPRCLGR